MKIETLKLQMLHRGVNLEGICYVADYPSAYMVIMEVPYKNLTSAEYFRLEGGETVLEAVESRATWVLSQLYERYQNIRCDYVECKKLLNAWQPYQKKIQSIEADIKSCMQEEDVGKSAFLKFYMDMLERDAAELFDELKKKHEMFYFQNLSLPALELPLKLIEEEFNAEY